MTSQCKLSELKHELELNKQIVRNGSITCPFKLKLRKSLIRKLKKQIKSIEEENH